MKKVIKQIKKTEYILEDKDIEVIKNCLNYCYHRLKYHKKTGIHKIVSLEEVNRLRREFDITKEKSHNEYYGLKVNDIHMDELDLSKKELGELFEKLRKLDWGLI